MAPDNDDGNDSDNDAGKDVSSFKHQLVKEEGTNGDDHSSSSLTGKKKSEQELSSVHRSPVFRSPQVEQVPPRPLISVLQSVLSATSLYSVLGITLPASDSDKEDKDKSHLGAQKTNFDHIKESELRAAYRQRCLHLHPDRINTVLGPPCPADEEVPTVGNGNTRGVDEREQTRRNAMRAFHMVSCSYELLIDTKQRAFYDIVHNGEGLAPIRSEKGDIVNCGSGSSSGGAGSVLSEENKRAAMTFAFSQAFSAFAAPVRCAGAGCSNTMSRSDCVTLKGSDYCNACVEKKNVRKAMFFSEEDSFQRSKTCVQSGCNNTVSMPGMSCSSCMFKPIGKSDRCGKFGCLNKLTPEELQQSREEEQEEGSERKAGGAKQLPLCGKCRSTPQKCTTFGCFEKTTNHTGLCVKHSVRRNSYREDNYKIMAKRLATLLVTVLILALTATARPKWHQLEGYTFEQYTEDFHKNYKSDAERATRRALFNEKLAAVKAHNAEGTHHSWKKGVNHMSDWTQEELKSNRGTKAMEMRHLYDRSNLIERASDVSIPDSLDYRTRKPAILTAVKDQGQCGSCWAHAATECMESAHAIKTGELFVLSQNQVSACTPNPMQCGGTGGCAGATHELAYDYVKSAGGLTEEWINPYTQYFGTTGQCGGNKGMPYAKFSGYHKPSTNSKDAVLQALVQYGPLSVTVDASSWNDYESGVFTGCNYANNITLDHGVQMVGYGHDAGLNMDYWTIRNSWSATFGEQGFIRIFKEASGTAAQCGTNVHAHDGIACKGQPDTQHTCGMCGVLFDTSVPIAA